MPEFHARARVLHCKPVTAKGTGPHRAGVDVDVNPPQAALWDIPQSGGHSNYQIGPNWRYPVVPNQ